MHIVPSDESTNKQRIGLPDTLDLGYVNRVHGSWESAKFNTKSTAPIQSYVIVYYITSNINNGICIAKKWQIAYDAAECCQRNQINFQTFNVVCR